MKRDRMASDTAFKHELKQRRKALDLTQAELAHKVGCSIYTVQRIEEGVARPSRQLAELLAARLELPPEQHAAFVQRARVAVLRPATAAPAREQTEHTTSPASANPYKGLRAFGEADAPDFFGREILSQRLRERLGEDTELSRFLAVVGPSGAGKSSVVRAGLIPMLRQHGLPGGCALVVADITPGTHPFEELEAALLRVAVNPPPSLMEQLRADERGLARAVKRVLPGDDARELVLLIDQFEELFTMVPDERVRAEFINQLFSAVADARSRLRVVITLRADFYDRPLRYLPASDLFGKRTEVVGPLAADELERAITGPAERHGLELERGLVAAIMQDVAAQPGTLPLMQYALTELYERRAGRVLTLAAYQSSGGVAGALARRAESLYSELTAAERAEVRQLFLRLITPGEGMEDTRRRVPVSELLSATRDTMVLRRVLDRYGRYRMLTFDHDPRSREPALELAHEALLRSWGRLDTWLADSRERLLVQRRLLASATEWQQSGREHSFLASGARLAQFAELAEDVDSAEALALTVEERAYVAASLAEQQRALAAERARQAGEMWLKERAARRLRYLVASLAVFLIVAAGLAAWALNRSQLAQDNLAHTNALRLAAEANSLWLSHGDNSLIALLSIRSLQIEYSSSGDAVLSNAAALDYAPREFNGDPGGLNDVAISSDGKYLAAASNAKTALLWDVATGKQIRTLSGHLSGVLRVAFSPDSTALLTASSNTNALDWDVQLWDVATGHIMQHFGGSGGIVTGVAFSPDGGLIATCNAGGYAQVWDRASGKELGRIVTNFGMTSITFSPDSKKLLTGGEDKLLRLWDTATRKQLRSYSGATETIVVVAFSPDGKYVAGGGNDFSVRLWDTASGEQLHEFSGHQHWVRDLTFSPDSRYLLSASNDYTARLWDVASGQLIHTFAGHTGGVSGVAFAPDGQSIATASFDGSARIWPVQLAFGLPQFIGHTSAIRQVSFSSDGKQVLTASFDKTARIWDAASGQELRRFSGHTHELNGAVFAPDGRAILTVANRTVGRLWDVGNGQELQQFAGHTAPIQAAAFVPDGKHVVTASEDGTARIWDVLSGQELARFAGHTGPVRSVAFAPDGRLVATGGDDTTARIWDPRTGKELVVLTSHADAVNDVAFSSDGKWLATASSDGSARLWDAATGAELRRFLGHTGTVYAVAFSPDSTYLLTGANDQTARVWNLQTGVEVRRLTTQATEVRDISFSPDGRYILTAGGDATARLWHTDYADTIRYLCGVLTRDLTPDERAQYGIADDWPTCRQQ
jgi:WD40 repeat protein/transcriptional regulator with XRE-family HTH domain